MLFHIHMAVTPPQNVSEEQFEQLKATEKAQAQRLMREGKWRHLWRIAGRYENYSIFDVKDAAELHDLLTSLPLFPHMAIEVTALCRHPSSVRDDDT